MHAHILFREMSQTMSMVVGPLQAALEEAIKAQQGLQLEVAQLTLKIEDLKEEHSEHIKDVGLYYYILEEKQNGCMGGYNVIIAMV